MNQPSLTIRSYSSTPHRHSHKYAQVVIPISGTIELTIDDKKEEMGTGRAALIPTDVSHQFSANKCARFIVADIDSLPSLYQDINYYFFWLSESFRHLLPFIETELVRGKNQNTLHLIGALFWELLCNDLKTSKLDKRIQQAINFMEQHYREVITAKTVAQIANLSESQFKLLFKKQTQCAFGQWLLNLRMDKAKALLRFTDKPINVIANHVGYENVSSFTRRFRQESGQSPSQFRG